MPETTERRDDYLCDAQSLEERLRDNALLVEVTVPAQRTP